MRITFQRGNNSFLTPLQMLGIAIRVVTTTATAFDMTVDTGRKTIAVELCKVATTNGDRKTSEAF
jgi:hypothetical protein